MTEIRFYHMERSTLAQSLPALLTKATAQSRRIIVQTDGKSNVESINALLWNYKADSFLPHGCEKDGNADRQPIWITDHQENPNDADVLILTHGASNDDMGAYTLCCEMLDGTNPDAVAQGRARWKAYKDDGHDITYWQQNERGTWEKKA